MKKHGLTIDCAHCQFIHTQQQDSFDVVVPVADEQAGLSGSAKLHCRVSADVHSVELTGWYCAEVPVIPAGGELDRRLTAALDFVAEKRVCGNRHLCPKEVVEVVEKKGLAKKP